MVTRPVLRYPGGKYVIATWVISHFPQHETYVELFGGAASVLMRKSRSMGEVYNDLDDEVVNVFRVLRDRESAKELTRLLQLTPFAYSEYKEAYEYSDDPIERARRMILRSFAGIGSDSVQRKHAGFRGLKNNESGVTAALEWSRYPAAIQYFVERLQSVVIECRDATRLINVYDREKTLFYIDPPYMMSTRSTASVRYRYEMDDSEHKELSNRLHEVKGMVVVSGYSSDLYDRLYAGWTKVEHSSKAQNGKHRVECLWLSPNIQTTLF
jgi:DNA adenine methylase